MNSTSASASSNAPAHAASGASTAQPTYQRVYVWQWGVRAFHWINAAALAVLFCTGLYIADPFFSAHGESYDVFVMARMRQIHFASAFVFAIAFVWRIYFFWFGNRYARSGFPAVWKPRWWSDLVRQTRDYLTLNFGHAHLGHNALAGLSYTLFVIGLGWCQILTGFALYGESNPGGFFDSLFGWVIPLLGNSLRTHMWHHLFAWGFVGFAIVHVYIVLLDSRQYRNGLIGSMITGYKFKPIEPEERKDS
ncbi:MAG: Ni/Fe-hydrogenase, b-type cytochrome subunit [Planctomycetes bacterium]|nr:Ni/Fe-hydrogenase, b-type cytochrome subunit [Planctomycetota bacterium]